MMKMELQNEHRLHQLKKQVAEQCYAAFRELYHFPEASRQHLSQALEALALLEDPKDPCSIASHAATLLTAQEAVEQQVGADLFFFLGQASSDHRAMLWTQFQESKDNKVRQSCLRALHRVGAWQNTWQEELGALVLDRKVVVSLRLEALELLSTKVPQEWKSLLNKLSTRPQKHFRISAYVRAHTEELSAFDEPFPEDHTMLFNTQDMVESLLCKVEQYIASNKLGPSTLKGWLEHLIQSQLSRQDLERIEKQAEIYEHGRNADRKALHLFALLGTRLNPKSEKYCKRLLDWAHKRPSHIPFIVRGIHHGVSADIIEAWQDKLLCQLNTLGKEDRLSQATLLLLAHQGAVFEKKLSASNDGATYTFTPFVKLTRPPNLDRDTAAQKNWLMKSINTLTPDQLSHLHEEVRSWDDTTMPIYCTGITRKKKRCKRLTRDPSGRCPAHRNDES